MGETPEAKTSTSINIMGANGCMDGKGNEFTMLVGLDFPDKGQALAFQNRPDLGQIQDHLTNYVRKAGDPVFATDPANVENFSPETRTLINQSILPDAIKSINEKFGTKISGATMVHDDVFDGCQANDPIAKETISATPKPAAFTR